jgi:DNA-binding SARP family transcriptional activator/ABC-type branched-subunit amino acid transport system substrate-binding protein/streptogramin lyase
MVEYRFLGPVEAVRDGQRVSLASGKQRALLAALLMERNAAVPADGLIDRLWGDRPPATVSKNLQVVVSQLRKSLGEDAIRTAGGGYVLVVAEDATDEEQFEHLLAAGREHLAAGKARDAERTLGRALALWRGRPYEDVAYEDFARDEITRLEERRLTAREERFDALLELGRNADAAAGLERLVSEHPYRERAIGQLMLALHRGGRRAEALAAYDGARRRMAEELGIEPGDRLRRLHAAILASADDDGAPLDDIARVRRATRVRRAWVLVATGGALLVAAAVTAAVVLRSGGEEPGAASRLVTVSGDHVATIDTAGLAIDGQYTVGATPTSVVGEGDTIYTLNADGQTISRVRIGAAEPALERGTVKSASDIALGGGALWVSSIERHGSTSTATIAEVDPVVLEIRRQVALPGVGEGAGTSVPLVFASGALYAVAPTGRLVKIDPETLRMSQGPVIDAEAVAAGDGAVWVIARGNRVLQIDPDSLEPMRAIDVPAKTGIEELAVGGGAAWAAEPFSGLLWRVHPGPPSNASSIRVGLSASDVAFGAGSVWVASGIDGAVLRIDPASEEVSRVSTGNAPQRVAVVGRRVLVTVAGARTDLVATRTPATLDLATLPAASCRPVVYGGDGVPDVLIASDFSLQGLYAEENHAMVQAIEYTLRRHGFRAGKYRVGYQSCDDTTPVSNVFDAGKCTANAKSYVATESVLAVIGTFYSGCATLVLPILNAAKPAPVPMISPANSYLGLTRAGPGNTEGDPGRFSRSGGRSFFRVYPSDFSQAEADAEVAESLGVTKPFVFFADQQENYQVALAYQFAESARVRGMTIVGPSSPRLRTDLYQKLAAQLKADGVDGAFLAGFIFQPPVDSLIRALRAEFGSSFPIIMPDAALPTFDLRNFVGPAAVGVYVSGAYVTDPFRQLPPRGQEFVREFSATQPGGAVNTFSPYAAQATEVVLGAVARSDGTRASVLAELGRTQIEDGILGSFAFDRNGDMTFNLMPVFQTRATGGEERPDRVFALVQLRSPAAGP